MGLETPIIVRTPEVSSPLPARAEFVMGVEQVKQPRAECFIGVEENHGGALPTGSGGGFPGILFRAKLNHSSPSLLRVVGAVASSGYNPVGATLYYRKRPK